MKSYVGIVKAKSVYQAIVEKYESKADCVILGCTEITMLIGRKTSICQYLIRQLFTQRFA